MTKIIALEGIDGTGKTTQAQLLLQRLVARDLTVMPLSFPVYDSFFGAQVGRLLSGKDGVKASDVDGKSMALWFAMDRFEAFRALDYSGFDVLLINRYVLSNAVYQSIRERDLGSPDLLDYVLELEHGHLHLPQPDIYVVLDMNPELAAENVGKKGFRAYVGSCRDVYESLPDIQRRAREKYVEYAARLDNVRLVPCMEQGRLKSIESIAEAVERVLGDII